MLSSKQLLVIFLAFAIVHQDVLGFTPGKLLKLGVHFGTKAAVVGLGAAAGKALLLKKLLIGKGLLATGAGVGLLGLKKAALIKGTLIAAPLIGAKKIILLKALAAKALITHLKTLRVPVIPVEATVNMAVPEPEPEPETYEAPAYQPSYANSYETPYEIPTYDVPSYGVPSYGVPSYGGSGANIAAVREATTVEETSPARFAESTQEETISN